LLFDESTPTPAAITVPIASLRDIFFMIASDANCSSTLCPLDDRPGQIEIKILYAGMNLSIGKSGFQDRQFIGSKTGTEVGFANKKRPAANGQRALSSFSVYPLLSREHRADRTLMSVPICRLSRS
jgi:hypothetical protein